MRSFAILLFGTLLSACATNPSKSGPTDLEQLRDWLSGSFSSEAQSAVDPEHYFHIQLHMSPIWQGLEGGAWLYVEQATAAKPDRPYRQRVYRLRSTSDGRLASDVYLLPGDPLVFAGAWRDPNLLAGLTPAQLLPREGCSIFLSRRADGSFAGMTEGRGCASELAGALYATSEVVLTSDSISSWDRGFDSTDKQVWGAELGPYLFIRQASLDLKSPEGR
ncbi:MAG: chromophore lyase CpcT/CpeT [Planctomycetota bacterium]|nr:chromophore lyase CpcT/CpeT [Planctomycetota bacterium]